MSEPAPEVMRVEIPEPEPTPPPVPHEVVVERARQALTSLQDEDPRTVYMVAATLASTVLGPWSVEYDGSDNQDFKVWVRALPNGKPYVRVVFEDDIGAKAHYLVGPENYEPEGIRPPSSIGVAMLFADHAMEQRGMTLVGRMDSEDEVEELLLAIRDLAVQT